MQEKRFNRPVVVPKAQTPSVLLLDAPLTSWGINVEWAKYISGAIEAEMRYFTDENDQFSHFLELLWNGLLGMQIPIGTITMKAGITVPEKWLECLGQAVSRTTYAALFANIGLTYGTGDNSTTFNIPNLSGRVPMGRGYNESDPHRQAGQKLGASAHTLALTEMPNHSHTGVVHNNLGTSAAFARGNAASAGGTGTTSAVGGGLAHNNLQPSLVLYSMIYAGV